MAEGVSGELRYTPMSRGGWGRRAVGVVVPEKLQAACASPPPPSSEQYGSKILKCGSTCIRNMQFSRPTLLSSRQGRAHPGSPHSVLMSVFPEIDNIQPGRAGGRAVEREGVDTADE